MFNFMKNVIYDVDTLPMIILIIGVLFGIGYFVYVVVKSSSVSKRTFPNTSTEGYISRANSEFDSNRTLMPKIEDFDPFKYNGYDVQAPAPPPYTNHKNLTKPYSVIVTNSEVLNTNLNPTILAEDKALETVSSVINATTNTIDGIASLSGINGTAEASLRESMVNSTYELRKNGK
jgi:hypothetical protein